MQMLQLEQAMMTWLDNKVQKPLTVKVSASYMLWPNVGLSQQLLGKLVMLETLSHGDTLVGNGCVEILYLLVLTLLVGVRRRGWLIKIVASLTLIICRLSLKFVAGLGVEMLQQSAGSIQWSFVIPINSENFKQPCRRFPYRHGTLMWILIVVSGRKI